MEMKKELESAFNFQINEELSSAYIYLSMAAYLDAINLSGMATWMKMQVEEENSHAMKLFKYLNDRGNRVELKAIPAPKKDWSSPLEVFKVALAHEKHITGTINKLMDLAHEVKDYAAISHLKWFVDEQVEEEANASDIVNKLEMIGDNKVALLILDKELGTRVASSEPTE